MIKFYIVSTLICYLLFTVCVKVAIRDCKAKGYVFKNKDTLGSCISILIKALIIMSILIFNILSAITIWFKYDEIVSNIMKEGA